MNDFEFSLKELDEIARLLRHYGDQLLSQQPPAALANLAAMRACLAERTQAARAAWSAEIEQRWPDLACHFQLADSTQRAPDFLQSGTSWLCEPIDGAVQYLHGQPLWTVTLCLLRDGQAYYAWVYHAASQTLYFAHKQHGAYANQRRLHCISRSPLQLCFLASSFPNYPQRPSGEVQEFTQKLQGIIPKVLAQRWMGPASLSLAQLAAGQIDGYWEIGRSLYDWLPGALLASEAGAKIADLHGQPLTWQSDSILIAQAAIHAELLQHFAD